MLTAEQIMEQIKILYEAAQKDKSEIWDKSMESNADPQDEFLRHLYMGECAAYETLLGVIEELEKDGKEEDQ